MVGRRIQRKRRGYAATAGVNAPPRSLTEREAEAATHNTTPDRGVLSRTCRCQATSSVAARSTAPAAVATMVPVPG